MKSLLMFALLAAFATVAAAQPDMHIEDSLTNGIPSGGIVPYDLQANFGNTSTAGQSYTFTIFSTGSSQLELTGTPAVAVVAGLNCSVTPTQPASTIIAVGDDVTFSLHVDPAADGAFDFTVSIDNNTGASPYTFSVEGVADTPVVPAQLQVSRAGPGVIAHGGDDLIMSSLGGQQLDFTYSLQNTGTQLLTFGSPALTAVGTHGAPIVSVTTAPAASSTLAGGASTPFEISVTPSAPGHWMVQIHISSNGVTSPYSYTISGDAGAVPAPYLEVRRGLLAIADGGTDTIYGTVDNVMTTLNYELENDGSAPMTFGTPSVEVTATTGSPTVNLVGLPVDGSTLAHHATVDFDIQITPDGAGAWSVTLSINSDGSSGGNHVVTITGTAQAVAAPIIAVLRNTITVADGGTDVITGGTGLVSFIITYTIRNEGAAPLSLTAVPMVATANPVNCTAVVSIQPSSSTVAAAGGTVTFTVLVTPDAAGAMSFDVSIANNDTSPDPFEFTVNANTGTGKKDKKDNGGCTTDTGHSYLLLALLGVLGTLAAARKRLVRP